MKGYTRLFATIALVSALLASSCSAAVTDDDNSAQVMAISLYQLVTVDNTFGGSPPPFTTYLIQTSTDPGLDAPEAAAIRPLTQNERDAIETAIASLGTVQWIDDPATYRTDDLLPTIDGAAILGVGEPVFDADGALVPVSLWCSGLCGTWFTYRLVDSNEGWQVTGIEGPRAIS